MKSDLPPSPDTPYKAVLIVAIAPISPKLQASYQQQGYLIIGADKEKLSSLNLGILRGRISPETRIDVLAHGKAIDNKHYIDGMPTQDFLAKITNYSDNHPLHIHLHSCYAGAAAPDVAVLPKGSTLVTHGEQEVTVIAIGTKIILESNRDLSVTDPVQDFANRFLLNAKQTATISINMGDGKIFQHSVSPPVRMLTDPRDIHRHFTVERAKFIDKYNTANIGDRITACPELTLEAASAWKQDYFLYTVFARGTHLLEAVQANPDILTDYKNLKMDIHY